jgi:hypothetical protein
VRQLAGQPVMVVDNDALDKPLLYQVAQVGELGAV